MILRMTMRLRKHHVKRSKIAFLPKNVSYSLYCKHWVQVTVSGHLSYIQPTTAHILQKDANYSLFYHTLPVLLVTAINILHSCFH